MSEDEIWKTIHDSETYEISNHGRVRNIKTKKYLKIQKASKGLPLLRIQYKVGYVNRGGLLGVYVAKHFIDNPHNYKYIRYIDGDYLNNRSDNIEWSIAKQNHNSNIIIDDLGRTCQICLKFKPWGDFSRVSTGANKKDRICKSCRKIERETNKEKIKIASKKYRESEKYKTHREKRKYEIKEQRKKNNNSPVLYENYADKLTVDEAPKKTYGGKLKVKCSFCGEYFIPTYQEISNRVQALNGNYAGERRLYCSGVCKKSCPIYYKSSHKGSVYTKSKYTTARDKEWSKMVLERDKYICQECGSMESVVAHHIIPVKEDFTQSADITNGICLCKKCHNKKHTEIAGCGYQELGSLCR